MTQLDKLREAVKNCGPVKITLGDTGVFEQEDKDVVIIHVLSTDLHNLRRKVENAVENTQTFPDYKPHITIAYVKKGKGKGYAEKLNTLKGKELTLDTLTFSDTDRNHVYFPLSKEAHQFLEDEQFAEGRRNHALIEKSKKHFGETDDIHEAGYLHHDGSMLDFSGKREGGSHGVRAYDHREVNHLLPKGRQSDHAAYGSRTKDMHTFMKSTGAIRLQAHGGELGAHIVGKHTPEQIQHLVRHARTHRYPLSVDVSHKDQTHSRHFDSPNVHEVHSWIESIKSGKKHKEESDEQFNERMEANGNTFRIHKNVPHSTAESILNTSKEKELKGLRTKEGHYYVWDAAKATHDQVASHLGHTMKDIEAHGDLLHAVSPIHLKKRWSKFTNDQQFAEPQRRIIYVSKESLGRRNRLTREARAKAIQNRGRVQGITRQLVPQGTPTVKHSQTLEGLPTRVKIPGQGEIEARHSDHIRGVAHRYMKEANLPYNPPKKYAKVDPARAKRIAEAYHNMKHDPHHPEVKKAYAQLGKETMAQYEAIKKHGGLKVSFIPHGSPDPYAASPRLATEDIHKNKHMWVYPTDAGFGSSDADTSHHPLLEETNEVISGKRARLNDIFRIVHDYFGHAKEGVGFRADGEENAWRSHAAMYTPLARKAMTSETRGQNSWVNYGPHAEHNKKASADKTVFADQKTGLMPDWTHEEGHHDHDISQHSEEELEYLFEEESNGGIPSNGSNFQLSEKEPHEYRLHEWMKRNPIPKQKKIPQEGTYPVIRTDDNTLHVDTHGYGSHVRFAKEHGIPGERIAGGGWLKDGDYREQEIGDSYRHGEQSRAKERVAHKRHIREALKAGKKVHPNVLKDHPDISQHKESDGGIPSNGNNFQYAEELTQEHLDNFKKEMHSAHPGLKSLWLRHHSQDNRIHLDDIQVHKEHRKQGIGSSVLKSLTKLADKHGHRISLTTATKDDHNGTTSSNRLKKFYGRFGFKKNKDLSVTANMMREPNSQHNEEYEPDLKHLLNESGKAIGIGAEKSNILPNGIHKHVSPHGSTRYVLHKEGKAIAGLQVVSQDKNKASVANVYTHPEHRRQGHATTLLQQAKKDFKEVVHSSVEYQSSAAKKWIASQHEEEQFAENDLLEKFLSQSLANQIQSTQAQIISLKSSELKLPELAQVVQQELRKLDQHLNQGLIHVGYQGAIEGTAEVVEQYEQLPAEQKVHKPTSISAPPTPSIEGDIPTPPKPPKSPLEALGEPIPPEVRLPDLERSIMQLMRPTAMVGTDWKETAELVKAGAFAITGDIAQHQSTEVQLALAEAMSEGHSASEFIETVQEKIFEGRGPLSNSHLETIFRTNTLRQKSNAKERTLQSDLVSDAFPYRAYNATEDARTRPHHKALEHLGLDNTNIYNADDPVFLKYRPVWWYSCRCNHYGVTVVQAANKGVKEAVEWVDRAKQTAEIEGGSFYQYLNTTKPLFFQMVPPVPFNDPSFNDSTPAVSQHSENNYSHRHFIDSKGQHNVHIYDSSGNKVASAQFVDKEDHLKVAPGSTVYVEPQHRRKGIATSIYNHIQSITGKKVKKSTILTPDGSAFENHYFNK